MAIMNTQFGWVPVRVNGAVADGAARTNGLSSAGFDGWIGGTCHRRTRGGLLRPPLADCLMDAINQIANTPCP
jgi:hypothetical protein